MQEASPELTEGALVSEEPPKPEIPLLFAVSILVPVFAVVLFFMMRIFGRQPLQPVDPPDLQPVDPPDPADGGAA